MRAARLEVPASAVEVLRVHIQADEPALRPYGLGHQPSMAPVTDSGIDDRLAGLRRDRGHYLFGQDRLMFDGIPIQLKQPKNKKRGASGILADVGPLLILHGRQRILRRAATGRRAAIRTGAFSLRSQRHIRAARLSPRAEGPARPIEPTVCGSACPQTPAGL